MSTKTPNRENSLGPISPADVPLEALPVVTLDQDRIEKALDLAKSRNESYHAINGGVVFGGRDSLTSHQIGLLGELAFACLYDLSVDTNTYQRGDAGLDHRLFGAKIDVKATATKKMRRPELLVRADKTLASDLYIRAHVIDWTSSEVRVRLIGCATKEVVESRKPKCHPGSTQNYVVPAKELAFLPHICLSDG